MHMFVFPNRFGVTASAAYDCVKRVSLVLSTNLLKLFVKWPSIDRQREISEFYLQHRGFPGKNIFY